MLTYDDGGNHILKSMSISRQPVDYLPNFSREDENLPYRRVRTCSFTSRGSLLWFRDIILEATYLGCHTTQVQKGLTIGVILFIVSEVFAFLSVFWAFFHSSLSPSIEIGGVWPPQGSEALSAFGIPLLNTFLLLSSGSTITYGHHALIKGDRK